jgi:hypothetical protein
MRPSTLLLYLAVAFFLVSCTYENKDIYVSPVKPPDLLDAAISLDNLNASTIFKPVAVHFKVEPSGKKQYAAVIKIDDQILYNLSSTTGDFYFTIDPAKIGNGEKLLRISVAYPSLSPSLAGQLGAEIVNVVSDYKFNVDIIPPARIAAPIVYLEDGKSMLKWNKPTKTSPRKRIFQNWFC